MARKEGAPRVSLAPKTRFPFPFKRLPRRRQALGSRGRKRTGAREGDTRGVSRAPVFSCAQYFHAPAAQTSVFDSATGPILRV